MSPNLFKPKNHTLQLSPQLYILLKSVAISKLLKYREIVNDNSRCVGYMSYDITGPAGATVTDANLTFPIKKEWRDPSFYSNLYIGSLFWGPAPIHQGLFSVGNIIIQGFSSSGSSSFICTASKLKEELQKVINDGKTRFQIRIHFMGSNTDNNSDWDGWEYDQSGVVLNVTGSY